LLNNAIVFNNLGNPMIQKNLHRTIHFIALRAGVVTCYIVLQKCCICCITFVQSERGIFLHELL